MTRVIPRDLFNDGNLLTNYGHLYIQLENKGLEHLLKDCLLKEDQFKIIDDIDGNTYLDNVTLYGSDGEKIHIYRSLNSRDSLSLWFVGEDDDYEVFALNGELSTDLLDLLQ